MYTFDLGSTEGMEKAVKAVTSVKEITEATKAISEPASQLVEQAKAAKKQMEEWTASMKEYGVVGEYANKVVDEYRQANIDEWISSLEESINPLSQYEQAVQNANQSVDDHKAALAALGATESEIAQIEAMRTGVLQNMAGALTLAFNQDMVLRMAQIGGNQEIIAAELRAMRQGVQGPEPDGTFNYHSGIDLMKR